VTRIGIDARKLGDTGVGRYTQSLLAALALTHAAASGLLGAARSHSGSIPPAGEKD
jgi:hypothetical protein